jgi:hypothetical protein
MENVSGSKSTRQLASLNIMVKHIRSRSVDRGAMKEFYLLNIWEAINERDNYILRSRPSKKKVC